MEYRNLSYENTNVEASIFDNGTEVREYQLIVYGTNHRLNFEQQVRNLIDTVRKAKKEICPDGTTVFARLFLSDSANQTADLRKMLADENGCAVSVIEQAPLGGCKVAIWLYLQSNISIKPLCQCMYESRHGSYSHLWRGSACSKAEGSHSQTRKVLDDYTQELEDAGCNLSCNCIRTWFFIQDIDNNYQGMVDARNEVFAEQSLTKDTHYIASTGIGGRTNDHKSHVCMDAYAVKGISERQVQYLHAIDNMNPTHEYGVSFERGTCVHYGDRRHVFVSGTASIDNKGQIMYTNDIEAQTLRMWDNVEAVLNEAGCGFGNIAQMLVYLRDIADYNTVSEMFTQRFPNIPHLIVLAPVCRPGWLIEMECIAIKAAENNEFENY